MNGPASAGRSTGRGRVVALMGVGVLVVGGTTGYVVDRVLDEQRVRSTAPAGPAADLAAVTAEPHVVFRSTARDSTYGTVAAVDLDDPQGPRALTDVSCERVASAGSATLCLRADRGVVTTYRTILLDGDLAEVADLPLTGLPSRARLSPDGSLAATTTFVTGHSYAAGDFSTQTLVREVSVDDSVAAADAQDVESFELRVDGAVVDAEDVNVWGVTFADDDAFYATAASGGQTWLVRGSRSARTLESVTSDAECPSLSPDGSRVVFKRRAGAEAGRWRLVVRDLASGEERQLAEDRSVDDQVEWLDDDRILYGMPREGADAAVTDVWVLGVDGDEPPEVYLSEAWSPTVVRTPD